MYVYTYSPLVETSSQALYSHLRIHTATEHSKLGRLVAPVVGGGTRPSLKFDISYGFRFITVLRSRSPAQRLENGHNPP